MSLIAHPEAVTNLILQAAAGSSSAQPSLATTGSVHDVRVEAGIAGASLLVGTGAVLLGRRLRRRFP
ncbi:hypothetical protein [Streptomyces sp900116325]|uniref:hypothetical protein n=1 Tax=Streptomyces sp. 900116325 TaxID=3154295 RepID=UPI0033A6B584